jgi:glycosyltransferase involved in cell wall biosynthesis
MRWKLLLYSHSWAPSVGGVETITMDLARGICDWSKRHPQEAWQVTLVTRTPAGEMNDSTLPFRVVRQPSTWELVRLFREADVLHLAGPSLFPMMVGWLMARRMVIEHHNYQSICPNGLLIFQPSLSVCPGHYMSGHYGKCVECNSKQRGWTRSLRDLLLMFPRRWVAKKANAHVAPSRHMQLRAQLPRTRVIYHGVADSHGPAIRDDTEAKVPPYFAFVGRLVEEKGVAVLLRAAAELKQGGYEFRIKIVGDGPEWAALQKMTSDLGLQDRVRFLGRIAKDQISSLLDSTRAVIMPSTCEEVAPLVLFEQMIDGRLVIGADIGGLGEFLEGTGLKFPPGDFRALAGCLRRVLQDPLLGADLVGHGRLLAREVFGTERMVRDHLSLYQQLLAG